MFYQLHGRQTRDKVKEDKCNTKGNHESTKEDIKRQRKEQEVCKTAGKKKTGWH